MEWLTILGTFVFAPILLYILLWLTAAKLQTPKESNRDQGGVSHSVVVLSENEKFKKFIVKTIYKFLKQRKESPYQFAVLFLSPHKSLEELAENTLFRNSFTDSESSKLTDCDDPTGVYPPDDEMVNYATARPIQLTGEQEKKHAEILLLEKFDVLLKKYGEAGENFETIVLYTWLLPCYGCKTKIIEKLETFAQQKQVILVYTTKGKGKMTKNSAEKIKCDLESRGIKVKKIKPPEKVKPVET